VRGGFEVFAGLLDEQAGTATPLDTPRKAIVWVRDETPVDEAEFAAAAFLACYRGRTIDAAATTYAGTPSERLITGSSW
jgi:hypothetical protein